MKRIEELENETKIKNQTKNVDDTKDDINQIEG